MQVPLRKIIQKKVNIQISQPSEHKGHIEIFQARVENTLLKIIQENVPTTTPVEIFSVRLVTYHNSWKRICDQGDHTNSIESVWSQVKLKKIRCQKMHCSWLPIVVFANQKPGSSVATSFCLRIPREKWKSFQKIESSLIIHGLVQVWKTFHHRISVNWITKTVTQLNSKAYGKSSYWNRTA